MFNKRFKATFIMSSGKEQELTLVLHREVGETEKQYQQRFAEIVSYKNGALHSIQKIQRVQLFLLCQGYCLSNCILKDVGPLEDY